MKSVSVCAEMSNKEQKRSEEAEQKRSEEAEQEKMEEEKKGIRERENNLKILGKK